MILVNGEYSDYIPIADRGLQYGDGLFETLEVSNRRPVYLPRHLQRLQKGCQRLCIPIPDADCLSAEVNQLCNHNSAVSKIGDYVLKIIITRGSGGRGYRQPDSIKPTRIISLHPFPDYPQHYTTQGVTVRFCQTRLGLSPLLAGLKHLNRLEQVIARAEWNDVHIQEGIMLDINDYVIEGTMSNLFFAKGGILYTPLLSQAGISGIMRNIIMMLARRNAIELVEGNINVNDLLLADEIFITNSIIGIWPVKQLEIYRYRIGALTVQLQAWLALFKAEQGYHDL